jgi:integrase
MADQNSNATALLERLKLERDKLTVCLLARNTRTGYRYGWNTFVRFAGRLDASPLPASVETVSLYTVDALTNGLKPSTMNHRLSAIARMHRDQCHPNPVTGNVKDLLLASRRLKVQEVRRVLPLTLEHLQAISKALVGDDTPLAARNRALLLVGFASALRGASLAELLISDAEFSEKGVKLTIRREKNDQLGRGRLIGIVFGQHPATCPVLALQDWLRRRRGPADGPLFSRLDWYREPGLAIQPEQIGRIVQQSVARIGVADFRRYSSHSLRAGFCTAGAQAGLSEFALVNQTGHANLGMLRRYVRPQDIWKGNPSGMLGL